MPDLINKFLAGWGHGQDLKYEPTSEVENAAKDFISKLQSSSIDSLFENVDEFKCDHVFYYIEKYGDLDQLKADIQKFVKNDPKNVILFMKSLVSMAYINGSKIGVYPDDIRYERFKAMEYYVDRAVLQEMAYKLYPGLKDKLPEGEIRSLKVGPEEQIIIQYLRYIAQDKG